MTTAFRPSSLASTHKRILQGAVPERSGDCLQSLFTLSSSQKLSRIISALQVPGIRKKLKKVRDEFDEMMQRIIEEHKEERRKRNLNGVEAVMDLLDILLDISEDENSEIRLTGDNIKAFIMDMFSGGTDTSAIATEWALAELMDHPNIMMIAAQELTLLLEKNRLVEESHIAKLHYLQAIVKETLRIDSKNLQVDHSLCENRLKNG